MSRLFILLQLIFVPLSARGWDIAVVTTDEVDFFSEEGKIIDRLRKPTANLRALELDPVNQTLFLTDDTDSAYSIFTLSLEGNQDLRPFIQRADNYTIQDIAYDTVSGALYWTGETAIYWYTSTMKNRMGDVIHNLSDNEFPHGITVASCRRYLYWTNSYHLRPTIERSLLDGTKREVLVSKDLFQPMGIAVDELEGKMYWSDEKSGIYYDIKRANLDGSNVETIICGTYHVPAYLTLHLHDIYWSDSVHNAVWKIPKEPTEGVQPTKIYRCENRRALHGIIAWSDGRRVDCQSERTSTIAADIRNSSESFNSNEPIRFVIPESSVTETSVSSDYCLHSGMLSTEKGSSIKCQCPQGYGGDRCEVSACDNYCLNDGKCKINYSGLPVCVCVRGTNGSRCEQHVCDNYCLNGAACEVNSVGQPACKCKGHFSGIRCEIPHSEHSCRSYCQQFGQFYFPIDGQDTPVCMCPSEVGAGQYEVQPLDNSSLPSINSGLSGELAQSCTHAHTVSRWILATLGCVCSLQLVAVAVLLRKVCVLRKRPRIRKRIIVNKNVTPLTSCPPLPQDQCEITIENCCNMNICETIGPAVLNPQEIYQQNNEPL
ncbi:protein cueball isoform X3 [Cryptotermes secundus]|uniref:protein cueball isoform X3 n=1 Tax=Cryptotermes secundus TaxID=105785 RepID=UPI000CD7B3C2|nr:protein cueball isoform X3 [Cryptotermes secundus]